MEAEDENIKPICVILMCTYNGQNYLLEQLTSIEKQTFTDWRLVASDDGSSDDTLRILSDFQKKMGKDKVEIFNGPKRGYAKNFHYVCQISIDKGHYFAFCDQDDIWNPNKLEIALEILRKCKNHKPGLYASTTKLVDEWGKYLSSSKIPSKHLSFQNAIIENIAGGNTMVFNKRLASIFCSIPFELALVSHDWALYQIVTSTNGFIHFDRHPSVDYRQHSGNSIGGNQTLKDKIERFKRFFSGSFQFWMNDNLRYLKEISNYIPEHHLLMISELQKARTGNCLKKIHFLIKFKVYRQAPLQTIIFKIGFVLGKV